MRDIDASFGGGGRTGGRRKGTAAREGKERQDLDQGQDGRQPELKGIELQPAQVESEGDGRHGHAEDPADAEIVAGPGIVDLDFVPERVQGTSDEEREGSQEDRPPLRRLEFVGSFENENFERDDDEVVGRIVGPNVQDLGAKLFVGVDWVKWGHGRALRSYCATGQRGPAVRAGKR